MQIASKEYVDSKIVNTGQRKTITLDLIPRCSKWSNHKQIKEKIHQSVVQLVNSRQL